MTIITYVFWICLGVIFYNYIGYGLILWVAVRLKSIFKPRQNKYDTSTLADLELPDVTLVIAAYNEEPVIEEKIKDVLSLDYPEKKLQLLFVTDGSTDRTPEMISNYPRLRLLHSPVRSGKTAALNRAMELVDTAITVFCDANTMLCNEAIRKIVTHYNDPEVGGVAGEKRVFTKNVKDEAVASEGLYWRYESRLKNLDAQLYTVVGAAGELFSIRTALWEPVEEDVILDDFVISLRVNLKGYRVAYEPEAYALELPSASIQDEKKRKVRISAGAFQAMVLLKPVFNFIKHPVLFFQFFSHRFLRWAVTPLCLPVLFLSNLFLVFYVPESDLYILALCAQLFVYMLALMGGAGKEKGGAYKVAGICYYVLFMNYSVFLGFARFIKGKQSVVWEKANREGSPIAV